MSPACGSGLSAVSTAATARMPASVAYSASTLALRLIASIAMPHWHGSIRSGLPGWHCQPSSRSSARKAGRKFPPYRKPSSRPSPRTTLRRPFLFISRLQPKNGIWPSHAVCDINCRAGKLPGIRCNCTCWIAPLQPCQLTRRNGL